MSLLRRRRLSKNLSEKEDAECEELSAGEEESAAEEE